MCMHMQLCTCMSSVLGLLAPLQPLRMHVHAPLRLCKLGVSCPEPLHSTFPCMSIHSPARAHARARAGLACVQNPQTHTTMHASTCVHLHTSTTCECKCIPLWHLPNAHPFVACDRGMGARMSSIQDFACTMRAATCFGSSLSHPICTTFHQITPVKPRPHVDHAPITHPHVTAARCSPKHTWHVSLACFVTFHLGGWGRGMGGGAH